MSPRILIVEDDRDAVRVIEGYLAREGYAFTTALDGLSGLTEALTHPPELVVLDWMLPGLSGLEFIKRLRREQTTPVIMLTARGEEADRVLGLELGADDYLVKPFSPRELVARINVVLRRLKPTPAGEAALQVGDLRADPSQRAVSLAGVPLTLTALEFELLVTLMRRPGHVFRRDELLDQVWGRDFAGVDRVVDVHVSNLRQKLETDPANPRWLRTVRGVGYRLAPEGAVT